MEFQSPSGGELASGLIVEVGPPKPSHKYKQQASLSRPMHYPIARSKRPNIPYPIRGAPQIPQFMPESRMPIDMGFEARQIVENPDWNKVEEEVVEEKQPHFKSVRKTRIPHAAPAAKEKKNRRCIVM